MTARYIIVKHSDPGIFLGPAGDIVTHRALAMEYRTEPDARKAWKALKEFRESYIIQPVKREGP